MKTWNVLAFSLIELMIVIAIVAILSAIAIPSYRTYVYKARIIEVIVIMEADLKKMTSYFQEYTIPSSNAEATEMTNTIDGFIICNSGLSVGTILPKCGFNNQGLTAKFDQSVTPKLPNFRLYFTPRETSGILRWYCTYDTGASFDQNIGQYLPNSCLPSTEENQGGPRLW
jgi:prepilin-type N-terminal cleavage/methylation domain-containing protein